MQPIEYEATAGPIAEAELKKRGADGWRLENPVAVVYATTRGAKEVKWATLRCGENLRAALPSGSRPSEDVTYRCLFSRTRGA